MSERDERVLSLRSVIFAVYDHSSVIVSADIRNRSRKRLKSVQNFASVTDNRGGVGGDNVYNDLFVLFGEFAFRVHSHKVQKSVYELDSPFAVRFFSRQFYSRFFRADA